MDLGPLGSLCFRGPGAHRGDGQPRSPILDFRVSGRYEGLDVFLVCTNSESEIERRYAMGKFLPILFFLACRINPFYTREPEPPQGGRLNLFSRTVPRNVVRNLELTWEKFSPADYMECLSEDFRFSPDPSDSSKFEEVFAEPWGRTREEAFARRLLDENVTTSLDLSLSLEYEEDRGDEHYFEYTYVIKLQHSRDAPGYIEGKMHLVLRRDASGNWSIVLWKDEKTGDAPTTGELRAKF